MPDGLGATPEEIAEYEKTLKAAQKVLATMKSSPFGSRRLHPYEGDERRPCLVRAWKMRKIWKIGANGTLDPCTHSRNDCSECSQIGPSIEGNKSRQSDRLRFYGATHSAA